MTVTVAGSGSHGAVLINRSRTQLELTTHTPPTRIAPRALSAQRTVKLIDFAELC